MHEERKRARFKKNNLPSFNSNCGAIWFWGFFPLEFHCFASIDFFSIFLLVSNWKGKKKNNQRTKIEIKCFLYWMLVLNLPSVSFFSVPVLFTAGHGEDKLPLSLLRSIWNCAAWVTFLTNKSDFNYRKKSDLECFFMFAFKIIHYFNLVPSAPICERELPLWCVLLDDTWAWLCRYTFVISLQKFCTKQL